jgi:UDP-2,4-diacetamido-2,4,6-trideoxy-beta-L-altropyranose hydrolase
MTDRPLAIFRCDASARIGGGHVVRCLALADALRLDGWDIAFAVSPETVETVPQLMTGAWRVAPYFGTKASEPALLRETWPDGADLIAIDHYERKLEYEAALKPWASRRLVISDLPERHDCELICDQTVGRRADEYDGLVPESCVVLAGAGHALLRPPFALRRHRIDVGKPVALERILVTFGLGGRQDMVGTVLDGLALASFRGTVDVVTDEATVGALRERAHAAVSFHSRIDAGAMADLLARADLTIGAGGTSVYERCCLGVPALLIALADNQRDNIDGIVRVGAGLELGSLAGLSPRSIAAAVERLMADTGALGRMRQAALAQTDGRGAERIALALRPERSKHDAAIELRPVTPADAETLYRFQQQPETRRYARVAKIPDWEEHVAWLTRKLADPTSLFSMVTMAGAPVGAIRLDASEPALDAPEAFEISIFVSSEHHNAGIGMASLKLARRLVPRAEIKAVVLEANEASLRLFRRAGYRLETTIENQAHFRSPPVQSTRPQL